MEIQGFKSFIDRSVLEFRDGITAIVGPNGCGKSNISDAIRWVMGEQRAKDLRGASMADVIFGGTQRKAPAQYAEVKLKLESDNFAYPYSEFTEVEIVRRLSTKGVSEYRINGAQCRLRDIRNLFLDSGVGTRAMSIIEQGKIHQIVTSKSEDRRGVIEEAAGINKFKESKKEALGKLEDVYNNLLRVQDVVGEVEKQYHYLKKQAAKALQHRELSDRIYELEVQLLSKQHYLATNALKEALDESRRTQEQLQQQNREMEELQERISREHQHITQLESKLNYHIKQREGFLQEKTLLEQKKESLEKSMRDFDDFSSHEAGNLTELNRLQDALKEEVEHFSTRISGTSHRVEELSSSLAEAQEELIRSKKKLETYREELELAREDSFATVSRITSCRNALVEKETLLKEAGTELQRCQQEQQELQQDLASAQREHTVVFRRYDELTSCLEETRRTLARLEERKQELESQLDRERQQHGELQGRAYEIRYQVQSARKILESRQHTPPVHFQHRFIEELHIPEERWRTPVLSLLGALALGYLVEELDGTAPQILAEQPQPLEIPGAVPISTLCQSVSGAPLTLPSHLYVAEQASTLCCQYPGLIFADWQGVLYSHACCLGAGDLSALQALEVRGEIETLEAELVTLEAEQEASRQRQQQWQEEVEIVMGEIQSCHHQSGALVPQQEESQQQIQQHETVIARVQKHLEVLQRESRRIEQRRDESRQQIEELGRELGQLGERNEELEEEIEDLRISIEHLEPRQDDDQARIGEQRIRLARLEESLQSDRHILQEKERKLEETREKIDEMMQRMEEYRQRESTSREEIQRIDTRFEEIDDQAIANEEVIAATSGELDELGGEARQVKQQLGSYRESIEKLEQKGQALHLQIEKHKLAMENINRQAEEKSIEISILHNPSGSALLIDEEATAIDIKSLRGSLNALGSVNMESIETYEEVKERYDFLTGQQEDLQQSVDSIKAGIDKIDQTTRSRFMETFSAVNEQFQIVFPRLFQGGSAQLRLTESDPLEAGLEIIAEPPGARPKTLNLLSGGQKTLTAAALIFAIFLVKPSPFCFMDEVDAPLDDSNVVRFSSMIKELARETQFIIITHNQRTMESADRLYGITMQEPGVSKIVGVDLSYLEQEGAEALARA